MSEGGGGRVDHNNAHDEIKPYLGQVLHYIFV